MTNILYPNNSQKNKLGLIAMLFFVLFTIKTNANIRNDTTLLCNNCSSAAMENKALVYGNQKLQSGSIRLHVVSRFPEKIETYKVSKLIDSEPGAAFMWVEAVRLTTDPEIKGAIESLLDHLRFLDEKSGTGIPVSDLPGASTPQMPSTAFEVIGSDSRINYLGRQLQLHLRRPLGFWENLSVTVGAALASFTDAFDRTYEIQFPDGSLVSYKLTKMIIDANGDLTGEFIFDPRGSVDPGGTTILAQLNDFVGSIGRIRPQDLSSWRTMLIRMGASWDTKGGTRAVNCWSEELANGNVAVKCSFN